jgi:hypothetical protein
VTGPPEGDRGRVVQCVVGGAPLPVGWHHWVVIKRNARLRTHHALTLLVTAVLAVVVAYVVLGWVIGLVAFLIKTAVVVCVVVLATYLVVRWARR